MAKELTDYKEVLAPVKLSYTHMVLTAQGFQFSIHPDEASAQIRADQIAGSVIPFIPNVSTYWDDTIGTGRYDH